MEKVKLYTILLPQEIKDWLDERSYESGMSTASFIRSLVLREMKKEERLLKIGKRYKK